ncbi:hypothetical protein H0H92_015252 [Tricholoma furcatifolium]|nr:hypothetical protein H0H92_015252 [Tricholoma furcatifolium]
MTALSAPIEDRLTFPPFPKAPSGVTITPFKNFKERGIQMFPAEDDQIERDGLGIPTVELSVRHSTDSCKTETTRKKKVEPPPTPAVAPGARKEWWDIWNENEHLKSGGPYNPLPKDAILATGANGYFLTMGPSQIISMPRLDFQLTVAKFRLFVGLLSNTPVWTRTDKQAQESDSDSPSDDEEEFARDTAEVQASTGRGHKAPPPRARPRPPYALYDAEPVPVSSDQEVRDLLNNETARREEQMIEFLNDPELKMRIFLSSYIRKQGLIWNLVNIPRLLGFFLRFVLRNRVFSEPEFESEFTRALAVVDLAQKELILTSRIAKQIPDDFSKGCFECFGRKSEGYKPIAITSAGGDNSWGNKKPDNSAAASVASQDEPDSKRAKLDVEEGDNTKSAADKFDEELKAANIIKIDPDVMMRDAEALEAIKDNLDPEVDVNPSWGGNSEGWGSSTDDVDNSWGAPVVDWEPAFRPSLFPFLGPTTFPLTHTTGIVECSVRKIKSYTAPPAAETLHRSPVTSEESPDAVEIELESRFAKVVLSPWLDWDPTNGDMPHMAKPRILETSVGPVRSVAGANGPAEATSGDAAKSAAVGLQPHDPFKDDITLLVEPALLPMLSPGMGVGGTWVQIARQQDFGGEKKKKKKSKAKVTTRYWYIDELVLTLPSYHT